jgi:hypothetical protein
VPHLSNEKSRQKSKVLLRIDEFTDQDAASYGIHARMFRRFGISMFRRFGISIEAGSFIKS